MTTAPLNTTPHNDCSTAQHHIVGNTQTTCYATHDILASVIEELQQTLSALAAAHTISSLLSDKVCRVLLYGALHSAHLLTSRLHFLCRTRDHPRISKYAQITLPWLHCVQMMSHGSCSVYVHRTRVMLSLHVTTNRYCTTLHAGIWEFDSNLHTTPVATTE